MGVSGAHVSHGIQKSSTLPQEGASRACFRFCDLLEFITLKSGRSNDLDCFGPPAGKISKKVDGKVDGGPGRANKTMKFGRRYKKQKIRPGRTKILTQGCHLVTLLLPLTLEMANFHEFQPWCRDVFRLFIWQVFRFFNPFSVDIWMILGHGLQRTLKSQQNKYLTWLEDLNQEVLNNSSCNHFVEAGSVIRYPCWIFSIVCSSSRTTDS